MSKQRISYVPLDKMDARMRAEMGVDDDLPGFEH